MCFPLGLVAGPHRGASGAAGVPDRHVRDQLRLPGRPHAAQVSFRMLNKK